MRTMILPKIHRTAVKTGVSIIVAATIALGSVTPSQAAECAVVASSSTVSGKYAYAGMTPDKLYMTDGNALVSATISDGPTLGPWQTFQSDGATYAFAASDARVGLVDVPSGTMTLYDKGKLMGTSDIRATYGSTLSGSWYMDLAQIASLDGVNLDLGKYYSYTETASGQYSYTEDSGHFGSLFLMKSVTALNALCGTAPNTYACPNRSSVTLTVRDAANGGKAVGSPFTLTPPSGASLDDLQDCSLQPGEVDCYWQYYDGGHQRVSAIWVTRSDLTTRTTTSMSLPVPPDLTSAPSVQVIIPQQDVFSDGILTLNFEVCGVGDCELRQLYAYDLGNPGNMLHLDGRSIVGAVGNRLTVEMSEGSYRVVDLPFGGGSAPHVIGVMGTKSTITPAAPLNLELDLSKPLKAGTLTIADPSGMTVSTLTTPASTDGSLRGLTWTPSAGVSGTYTWTLTATDSSGQVAVNTVGDAPASGTFTVKSCAQFTDVAASNTFAPAICWVSATGITHGTGDGSTYSPSNPVNRGSMAAFLYRLAGSPKWDPPTTSPFVDVKTTDTFYPAITWLQAQGITVGTTVGGKVYYQPTNAVNRGSMSAFLYRFSASPKWTLPITSPFADVNQTNTFYKSITWLADQKITVGSTSSGKVVYQPGNPVNRGSMAAFMQRLTKTELQCMRYGNAVGC